MSSQPVFSQENNSSESIDQNDKKNDDPTIEEINQKVEELSEHIEKINSNLEKINTVLEESTPSTPVDGNECVVCQESEVEDRFDTISFFLIITFAFAGAAIAVATLGKDNVSDIITTIQKLNEEFSSFRKELSELISKVNTDSNEIKKIVEKQHKEYDEFKAHNINNNDQFDKFEKRIKNLEEKRLKKFDGEDSFL